MWDFTPLLYLIGLFCLLSGSALVGIGVLVGRYLF